MHSDVYDYCDDSHCRFALGFVRDNPLVVFGVNPSTATDLQADPTLRKVAGFAQRLGHDSYLMLNVFPLRSPDPRMLPRICDPLIAERNQQRIAAYLEMLPHAPLWAAWGEPIGLRPYLRESLAALCRDRGGAERRWIHCGSLTRNGHPRHPARLSYRQPFQEFSILSYIAAI